ncbi:hypothetical protein KC19_VG153100 [Ceratodon purpureus]|uniref:Uncharacterized protein n=1 Tax=Ceratodon purpureus TaxID=3225 RepID=A0A8T0HQN1_CERPU|nr:hypothetical protein KC19_VG153100 [Ceratodon purpureus]
MEADRGDPRVEVEVWWSEFAPKLGFQVWSDGWGGCEHSVCRWQFRLRGEEYQPRGSNIRLVNTLVFFYWRGAKTWKELVLLENQHDFCVTRVNIIFVLNFAYLLVEMK